MAELVPETEVKSVNLLIFHDLIAKASEQGAAKALESLGLADKNARKDMDELRELLSAWRDAKRTARQAVVGWIVKVGLALFLIGLAVRLGLPELIGLSRH